MTKLISDWRHALIALGFAALAIVAAIYVPESRWEKLGLLVERIAEDPAGFVVLIGVLGGAITTLRGAWVRTPPPAALVLLLVAPWLAACSAGPQMPVVTIPVNVSCTWTSGGGSVADAAPGGDLADNDCLVDHVSPATSTDTTGNDNRGARVDATVDTTVSATP